MKKYVVYLLFFISTVSVADPVIQEHQDTYKIDGTTALQLRNQMTERGPADHGRRVDAMTHWSIKWSYTWHYDNPAENPCYLSHVEVKTDISYLMPEWSNIHDGEGGLQARWNSYVNSLKTHEQGHAENGKRAASEIERALLNTPPASSCQALHATLEETAHKIIQQHNDWDIQYDAQTDHGRTQGAVFP